MGVHLVSRIYTLPIPLHTFSPRLDIGVVLFFRRGNSLSETHGWFFNSTSVIDGLQNGLDINIMRSGGHLPEMLKISP